MSLGAETVLLHRPPRASFGIPVTSKESLPSDIRDLYRAQILVMTMKESDTGAYLKKINIITEREYV